MKFKRGQYCIVDQACELNFKEYKPVKVAVIKRMGLFSSKYLVTAIEPIIYPVTKDNYSVKYFIIHKKYLTPTTLDEKVVIRCPVNMPKFSKVDDMVLTKIYDALVNHGNISQTDILRLKIVIQKIRYIIPFNEVKDIES